MIKEKIIKEYLPKEYIIEEQKFDIPDDIKNVKISNDNSKKCEKIYNFNWTEVMFSMTYSMKKVLLLMREYENKNNFRYDVVILTSMDMIWLVPLKLSKIDLTAIYNPRWGKDNSNSKKKIMAKLKLI